MRKNNFMSTATISGINIESALIELGLKKVNNGTSTGKSFFSNGEELVSYSPVDGSVIGSVKATTIEDYEKVIATALSAYKYWRNVPAPKRGEIVRQFGDKLRNHKQALGQLVS